MADRAIEITGKSVDEAIADGLAQLGLTRDQVDVEILSRGSRGIFGLGSEPARVRLTPHRAATTGQPARPAAPPVTTPIKPPVSPPPTPPATPPQPPVSQPAVSQPAAPAPRTPRLADMEDEEEEEQAIAKRAGAPAETAAETISDAELEQMAADILSQMVRLMGFDAQVNATWHEADQPEGDRYLLLDIQGHDLSPLIGRRGETLASIQYLVRLMVNQRLKTWKNIVVDVDHYKERRVAQLTQLAHRMAEQVAQSGRAVSLEPMPPNERRIIHLALRDHDVVYTQSSGEGDRRKVHIVAKS